MDSYNDIYAKKCSDLIVEYENNKLDLRQVCMKIRDIEPKGHIHPMLWEVESLAFDISEDIETEFTKLNSWRLIKQIISDYMSGNWYPTRWMLSASYNASDQGHSVSVARINNKWLVESSNKTVFKAVSFCLTKMNYDQTDEWFLSNLLKLLPAKISRFNFMDASVDNYLITLPGRISSLK
jgi:hypothetical protein